ncbi:hypothetical protein M427DRAFT_422194 [Gonapodya prolifera JEL478]|uniref:Uncharacterized protein n=1 Tax=Gonapodya prolifera (strain JEL478) TaxID=1344416 RepID=A0A139A549_GONPJ|nr:hypothetical protein M427DRAFT_422194 [Gonapodya prolifera JEL478]|eukprot:KXS11749.1 hypothetical protein M427DRAFT_422194 [Gonapodya prolifera JEL478]
MTAIAGGAHGHLVPYAIPAVDVEPFSEMDRSLQHSQDLYVDEFLTAFGEPPSFTDSGESGELHPRFFTTTVPEQMEDSTGQYVQDVGETVDPFLGQNLIKFLMDLQQNVSALNSTVNDQQTWISNAYHIIAQQRSEIDELKRSSSLSPMSSNIYPAASRSSSSSVPPVMDSDYLGVGVPVYKTDTGDGAGGFQEQAAQSSSFDEPSSADGYVRSASRICPFGCAAEIICHSILLVSRCESVSSPSSAGAIVMEKRITICAEGGRDLKRTDFCDMSKHLRDCRNAPWNLSNKRDQAPGHSSSCDCEKGARCEMLTNKSNVLSYCLKAAHHPDVKHFYCKDCRKQGSFVGLANWQAVERHFWNKHANLKQPVSSSGKNGENKDVHMDGQEALNDLSGESGSLKRKRNIRHKGSKDVGDEEEELFYLSDGDAEVKVESREEEIPGGIEMRSGGGAHRMAT